ncbi:hypothetical protein BB560_005827 [Smittium megazygosporum]|uniref:Mitochondrial import inner membrane translocase subunit TIM22 n=1 Tax=Smittium megazygosporum TaxID=133381 RepID=A0A2T9YUS3_9FUNG|nr:hypothetical protein BB560_005827 [Smittium megazygosporum]
MAEIDSNRTEYISQLEKFKKYKRMNLDPFERMRNLTITGFSSGFVIGAYIGGRNTGWQYLAERAHNLPRTTAGWYYYKKWKNYRVIMGGLKKGSYYGVKLASITAFYQAVESACDCVLFENVSMLSSLVSGFTVSLTYATLASLSRSSFYRIVKFGTVGGFCSGLVQDGINWYQTGETPFYLSYFNF